MPKLLLICELLAWRAGGQRRAGQSSTGYF